MNPLVKSLVVTLGALALVACGGGGGGGDDGGGGAMTASFVHQALPANSLGSLTTLNHPLLNSNPNAYVLVTPLFSSTDFVYLNHPLTVQYLGTRWVIGLADLASMPASARFHVTVSTGPTAGATSFTTHTSAPANIDVIRTFLNHPAANGNPSAIIVITQNASPGGAIGATHNHPTGLVYDGGSGRWAIFNRDSAVMASGVSFNYAVVGTGAGSPFTGATHHITSAGGISSGVYYPGLPDGSATIVHATPVFETAAYNRHFAVLYNPAGGGWGLMNEDATAMATGVGFNVARAAP